MTRKDPSPYISPNIIVLGCGFSGMLTALAFASFGINTTIVESKSVNDPSFFEDIRTTAITKSSQIFLHNISVWERLKDVAGKIADIYVVDNKAPEILHFAASSVKSEALGHIIKNSDFKRVLLVAVQGASQITLIDQCNYTHVESGSHAGTLYLENGEVANYDLLIICEGHNSRIRKTYFTKDMHKYYGQTALTFLVSHSLPHAGTAVEHFMPSGPFAILPLHEPNSSSIVWTLGSELSEIMKNLPTEEFEYLIQQNFGDFLGEIKLISCVAGYPLKAYLTHRYFYERIILIADSAHIIHPLAGQGLNMGIKDIIALTTLIKEYGISASTLGKYQDSRQVDNKAMYLITDNLNRIFSSRSKVLWRFRRTGLKIMEHFTPLKSQLIEYAMGKRLASKLFK